MNKISYIVYRRSKKMATFNQVMLFYLVLTVILGFVGNYYGKPVYGVVAGLVISVVLWYTVGKNMVKG